MERIMSEKEKSWWAPIRIGLVADNSGKHYQKMGKALWLYVYLHAAADWETGELVRKYETISSDTGIPTRSLQRMMRCLEKYGYVRIVRLAQSMAIKITKWRPISPTTNGGSQEVIRQKLSSDPPLLTSPTTNGDSLKSSEQKANIPSPTNNGGSI